MKNRLILSLLASFTLATSATNVLAQTPQLVPMTTFGPNGDGSIRPGDLPFITGDGTTRSQRGMAYNPTTDHLLIAHRAGPSIHILDATNGTAIGTMPFNVLIDAGNTGFRLSKIGVADDGAVYVANLTSASTAIGYVLYRYASETGEQTLVYVGDPSNGAATSSQPNGRWGDTMTVRGAGINTEILIATEGTLAAILRPTDETMTAFTATTLATDASSGGLASGLSFGAGNTFWAKASGSPLRRFNYDLGLGTATTDLSFGSTTFPTQVAPILNIGSSNLFVGIQIAPGFDFVKLYDVANVSQANPPVFLDRESYTTNFDGYNAGQICHSQGRVWALNTEHGIRAFTLQLTNELVSPSFFLQPVGGTRIIGTNITFSALADGIPTNFTYQWYFNRTNLITDATNTTHSISNLQTTNAGTFSVVASNSVGSVTSSVVTLLVVPDAIMYVYEPFNYAVGQYLTNCTVAPGQTWSTNGSSSPDSIVTPDSLNIPGLAPSIGNSFTNGGSGSAARLSIGGAPNSGAVYASFAMRINSLGAFTSATAPGFIASFVNNASNDQLCRLAVRTNATGQINLGVGKATTSGVFATNDFALGETIFVVLRYTFVSGGTANDLADLWLNPPSNTFATANLPAPSASAVITGTDISSIDTWAFRQNTAANTPANIQYDELRIGNKWELVTPIPAANVSLNIARSGNSIVLSWPTAGSEDFLLESASALASPTLWGEVSAEIEVQGANNTVTLPISGSPTFYRLRK